MIGCDRRQLSYYLDGELSQAEEAQVRLHLSGCADCRRILGQYQRLGQQMRDEPLPPLPAGFARRVYTRVGRESPRRSLGLAGIFGRAAPALVVAALVAVFAGTFQHNVFPPQVPAAASAVPAAATRAASTAARAATPVPSPTRAVTVAAAQQRAVADQAAAATTVSAAPQVTPTSVPPVATALATSEPAAAAAPTDQPAAPAAAAAQPQTAPAVQAAPTEPPPVESAAPTPVPAAPAATQEPQAQVAVPAAATAPPATTGESRPKATSQPRRQPTARPAEAGREPRPTSAPTLAPAPAESAAPASPLGGGPVPGIGAILPAAVRPGRAITAATAERTGGLATPVPAESGGQAGSGVTAAVTTAQTPEPAAGGRAPAQGAASQPGDGGSQGSSQGAAPQPPAVEPTPLPTVAVADVFQAALASSDLAARLGQAVGTPMDTGVVMQPFERGWMLRRGDVGKIYVLLRSGNHFSVSSDAWKSSDAEPSDTPLGPKRGLGKLWRDNANVHKALGNPTDAEQAVSGVVQAFQKGILVWNGSTVYAFFADGSWSAP